MILFTLLSADGQALLAGGARRGGGPLGAGGTCEEQVGSSCSRTVRQVCVKMLSPSAICVQPLSSSWAQNAGSSTRLGSGQSAGGFIS